MMLTWLALLSDLPAWASMGIKMTLLLAAGSVVHVALTGRNPRWRVLAWRGAMIGVLLLPLTALILLGITVPLPQPPVVQSVPPALPVMVTPPSVVHTNLTVPTSDALTATTPPTMVPTVSLPMEGLTWLKDHSLILLAFLWLFVAAILLLRILLAVRQVRRLVHATQPASETLRSLLIDIAIAIGCSTKAELRTTFLMKSPFLAGLLRPIVVIPKSMADDCFASDLPAIFAHELSHLNTRDLFWLAFAKVISAIFWFHPLVWVLRAAHAAACESVCDAVAADYVGGAPHYTKTLARVALEMAGEPTAYCGVPMLRSAEITRRIRKLSRGLKAATLSRRGVAAAVAIGLVVLFALGGVRLVRADQEPDIKQNSSSLTSIAGIVVDETGKPVVDAKVVIFCEEKNAPDKLQFKGESRSGVDGRFSIDSVMEKSFYAISTHPDYGISIQDHVQLSDGTRNYLDCRVVMPQRDSIQGKVVDPAGKPIQGAEVTALLSMERGPLNSIRPKSLAQSFPNAKTDANGVFTLDHFPRGYSSIIRVSHPDYATGFAGTSRAAGYVSGTIMAGATDITITLQPGATVEGKIVMEGTNESFAHVPVTAQRLEKGHAESEYLEPACTETTDTGVFTIKNLAPGNYRLIGRSNKEKIVLTKTIEITGPTPIIGQNLSVIKGVRIAGKFVKENTNEPFVDGSIRASEENPQPYNDKFELKPDGTFEGWMPPGEVTLQATISAGFLTFEQQYRKLTLVAGQDQNNLEYKVGPMLVFKGRVLDTAGNPVAGAKIVEIHTRDQASVLSEQDGSFAFPLPFQITGNEQHQHYGMIFSFDVTHPEKPGLRGFLEKSVDSNADLTGDIALVQTGTIRGRVLDTNGYPILFSRVNVVGTGSGRSTYCDATGRFEIKDIVGGKACYVQARADKAYGQANSEEKTFEAGATWDVGTLILQPTDKAAESATPASTNLTPVDGAEVKAVIAGIVVDEAGKPITGASVVVQKYRPIGYKTHGKILAQEDTISGSDGKFSLRLSRNESRFLMFTTRHPDYGISIRADFELGKDKKDLSDCRIVMAKRGAIQGKVVDIANKPVENVEITVFLAKKPAPDTTFTPLWMPDKSLFSAKTGADGTFTLDGLPQDSTVVVHASHPDYAIGIVGRAGNNIAVGSTNIIVTLKPGATIEGKITWEEINTPIAHVPVYCLLDKTSRTDTISLPDPVETDDQGAFQIKGLDSGSYKITSFFNEGLIVPKSVDVAQAAKLTGQNLTATKGVRISGEFVRTDTREPLQVELYARLKSDPFKATFIEVKPDGTFMGRVMPGETILQAKVKNGSPVQQEKTLTLVKGQDQMDLVFEVKMSPKLKVRVLDSNKKPVAGAKVLFIKGADEGPSTTNKDGICEYFVPPHINLQNKVIYPVTFEASQPDKPELHGMLTKEITSEADLICDIVLNPVGIIRGKVADIAGKPVPSAKVTVYTEENGRIDHETTCDEAGQFEIKDVITGVSYSVKVKAGTAWIKTDPTILKPGTTWDVGVMKLP